MGEVGSTRRNEKWTQKFVIERKLTEKAGRAYNNKNDLEK